MAKAQQTQKPAQILTLSPRLQQSLEVLQAPALELRNIIISELENNPVLEELPLDDIPLESTPTETPATETDPEKATLDFDDTFDRLLKLDADWEDDLAEKARTSTLQHDDRRQHLFNSLTSETSLQEYLMQQAHQSDATPEEVEALRYLIGSLDDRGYLTVNPSDPSLPLQIQDDRTGSMSPTLPRAVFEKAANLLKAFDPPGIGAADLQECLLTQLQLKDKGDSLAAQIVAQHYDLFLHRRIPELQKKLAADPEDLKVALKTISALDPAPGRKFSEDHNHTILPDVTVQKDGSEWRILLNSASIPKLRLSSTYKSLLAQNSLSVHAKEYIRRKIRSGKHLINAIAQRQETLERITRELLNLQKGFFKKGPAYLKPLIMKQIAEPLGVHETTISRAVANKYLESPYGLFAFKYFFTGGYTDLRGRSISRTSVKEAIAQVIQKEDPLHPISDQEIASHLAKRQIKVARRTIAKYREELNISPAHLRRKYDIK